MEKIAVRGIERSTDRGTGKASDESESPEQKATIE
jgi:hypothetical protein